MRAVTERETARAKRGPINNKTVVGRKRKVKWQLKERSDTTDGRQTARRQRVKKTGDPLSRRHSNVTTPTAAVWRGSRVGGSQGRGLRDPRWMTD